MSHDAYTQDRTWESQYHGHVKALLGKHLLVDADDEEDTQRNTDMTTLKMKSYRVGVRIRRNNYLHQVDMHGTAYTDQFTIRADRPNGAMTELAKIMSGWGDYFFYGFENDQRTGLACWLIGDLYRFRWWFYTQRSWESLSSGARNNRDGSSAFYTFDIADLPHDFVVARRRYEKPHQPKLDLQESA
jgi:hypothetical protein